MLGPERKKFPFLSVVTYRGSVNKGVVNNQDTFITSMYVYGLFERRIYDWCEVDESNE